MTDDSCYPKGMFRDFTNMLFLFFLGATYPNSGRWLQKLWSLLKIDPNYFQTDTFHNLI